MKKEHPSPPPWSLRFFRWFCHPDLKKYIEGDLMELYDERVKASGKRKADIKFIIDVFTGWYPSGVLIMPGWIDLLLRQNG